MAEAIRRLAEAERLGVREAEHAAIVDAEIAEQLDRELLLRILELDDLEGVEPAELEARLGRLLHVPGEPAP